jgi:HSP20 family protein
MSEFSWKLIRLRNLEQQIDQAFDELIHRPWGLDSSASPWQPEIDIYDMPECYLVEADVPGVPPDEIRVEVEAHSLTISGSRRSARIEQSAQSVCLERRKGSFFRRFVLEQAVDPQRVERTIHEGTLTLKIPKQQPRKPQ